MGRPTWHPKEDPYKKEKVLKRPLTEQEVEILTRLHHSNIGNLPLVLSKREGSVIKRLCDKGHVLPNVNGGYKVTHKGAMAIKELRSVT